MCIVLKIIIFSIFLSLCTYIYIHVALLKKEIQAAQAGKERICIYKKMKFIIIAY